MMALMGGGFGTPGLQDGSASGVPEGGAKQKFVDYCNVKCIEDRTMAAATAYQKRNEQTTASIMGTSQGAGSGASGTGGSTASISGASSSGSSATGGVSIDGSAAGTGFRGARGVAVNSFGSPTASIGAPQCDPAWRNLSAGALASIQANPATTPATLQMIQACTGAAGAGGFGLPQEAILYTDPGQCVVACMAQVDATYGPKPEERGGGDISGLLFMLQQSQQSEGQGRGFGGEPTPPYQMGDYSDGSGGDNWTPPVAPPTPEPVAQNDEEEDD